MNLFWTTLCTLMTFFAFAQKPTGDIQKDTALANQYLKKAINLYETNDTTMKDVELLKQAHTLYETYPFNEKLIEIKGWLGLQEKSKPTNSISSAQAAIDLAKKEMPHVLHPTVLAPAYLAMCNALREKNKESAFQYALKGRLCADKKSKLYYKISTQAISMGCVLRKFDLVNSLIAELTNALETHKNDNLKEYWKHSYTELALNLNELTHEIKGFEKPENLYNEDLVATLKILLVSELTIYKLEPSDRNLKACFYTFERLKAIQLVKILSPKPLTKDDYPELKTFVEDMIFKKEQIDSLPNNSRKDSIEFYKKDLLDITQRMERYLGEVEVNFTNEIHTFSHVRHASLVETQKQLSKETLLIEYIDAKSIGKQFIFTIGQSEKNIYESDGENLITNIKKLDELIQDRFAFQKPTRNEFIEVSHELYKTLIEPIEAELEGKTKLMIVVEGQLFHLPFELLLKSKEKKPYHKLDFLIKKYEVNYHYSATTFLKLKEKATIKNHSLLAFAPVFSKGEKMTNGTRSLDFMVDSLYKSIENFEFVALPNTKKEVKAIAKLVKSNNGKTMVLLRENATKDKLAQHLERQPYQFIHIATHSLVNFKDPKRSALACYSKDSTMDNLFYADEIQFKKINADLVILSSCESGIGQLVQGEGLIALNRSFIYSGTKNVIFSLWKVSDKYSSKLMIDFYKSYFEKPSYTNALRQAKLKMLKNPTSAQPRFWSAFVLMGE